MVETPDRNEPLSDSGEPGTGKGGASKLRAAKIYILGLAKKVVAKGLNKFGYEITKMERTDLAARQAGLNLAGDNRRIHYACGFRMLEGWLNMDAELLFKTQPGYECRNVNLVGPHPFPDNWFEYGFCEDFLEHLNQSDSIIFLSEVYRTFKEGGVLRLSFPGLDGVLKRHGKGSTYEVYRKLKNEAYTVWGHIHFYSKEELSMVCEHIGFNKVEFVRYGESDHSPLRGLDYREDQRELNIYVELTK